MELLQRGLIVSCQAQPDEPMYGSPIMARLALAAQTGGAVGVRINTEADIRAVKQTVTVPVIGIIKQVYPNCPCYITPTLAEVAKVVEAGAEIVAVDGTQAAKPDGKTTEQFIYDSKNRFNILLMADVSTVEEGIAAARAGADLVATTLSGYTEQTRNRLTNVPIELQQPDFDLVSALVDKIDIPVIAEGRFWDGANAVKAMSLGAYAVVIGAGITRPQIITAKHVNDINRFLKNGKDR
ncbi:N-acetylmannosamine-6-phosphate 2-epimerase [Paenibacillus cymbidii]|uniref:N-acetylmannosamine-6-phosphate 2-epimerase n=1 Tax=Paenibacillus cymbidii TaxID=1639034 RepID=UPI0010814470|nr:N-acetylmannosamine-6-phosphate 2-epimerase [Paenibacillus cymbidii]